jgi:putative ABC transport system permease protein
MIRFIAADLRRLWAGSLVIVLLVALATALGVAVTLQERALRLGSARAADRFDLVVGAAGSETQLVLSSVFLQAAPLPLVPGKVLAELAADPRVAFAAPVGFGDSFSGFPIVGTTAALIEGTGGRLADGRLFAGKYEAVAGSAVPLAVGQTIKPMHGLAGEGGHVHGGTTYSLVGRLSPTGTPWDRAILVPIEAVWAVHGMGADPHDEADHDHAAGEEEDHDHDHDHDHEPNAEPATLGGPWSDSTPGVPAILVKPKTIADAYKLRGEYRAGATLAVFPGEVLTRLYTTLGDARTVLGLIATGAQLLVAAAIALVTIVHVTQRRRQIGALRALGSPRAAIFAIVWGEIFALVAIGVLLGFAIGFGAALVLSSLFTQQNGVALPVEFLRADLWLAACLLLFAAILAAIPAALAFRQPAAAALRS